MPIRIYVFFVYFLFIFCAVSQAQSSYALEKSRFIFPEYSESVSMDFKDAQLVDVLKLFSKQTKMNFVAAEDISSAKVTLFFEDVPIEDALQQILRANNLTYEFDRMSEVFLVKKVAEVDDPILTRVFRLQHATVDGSSLKDTFSVADSGDSGGGDISTGDGTEVIDAVKAVLSEDGSVIEDTRTNSLLVTDSTSQFPLIEQIISRLDVPIPQILIEVEMLDVSKGTADKIGVEFGEEPLTFSGATRNTLLPFDQNDITQKEFFDLESFRQGEFGVGTIDASGFQVMLRFLRTQTDTRNLARPRLMTLNNHTAQIQIATDEAIGATSTSSDSTGGGTEETTEAERIETGVFLTVTPQANIYTNEITMAISPRVVEARRSSEFSQFKDPEERGSNSVLKVISGETIVLGGLLRTEHSETITKLPFFGDIPGIGRLFKHEHTSQSERELIIFITPKIIDGKKVADAIYAIDHDKSEEDYIQTRQGAVERELDMLILQQRRY